jgi:hypothetical protein
VEKDFLGSAPSQTPCPTGESPEGQSLPDAPTSGYAIRGIEGAKPVHSKAATRTTRQTAARAVRHRNPVLCQTAGGLLWGPCASA